MLGLRIPHNGVMNLACPANRSAALNKGCIGWWLTLPNNLRSTVWPDIIGKNNGTLTSMDPTTDWGLNRPMRPGGWGCLDFDGSNDYVSIAHDTSLNSSGEWTIACWVYPISISGLTQKDIISKGGTGGDYAWRMWFPASSSSPRVGHNVSFNSANVQTTTSFSNNTWYHVVGSRVPNGNTKIYVNGVNEASTAASTSTGNTSGKVEFSALDQAGTPANPCNMRLDDVRLYSRQLSDAEVKQLYDASRFGYQNELNRVRRPWAYSSPAVGGGPVYFPPYIFAVKP